MTAVETNPSDNSGEMGDNARQMQELQDQALADAVRGALTDQEELSVPVPVRVERGSMLPPEADPRSPDRYERLDQVRTDIAAQVPEEARPADTLAQKLVEQNNSSLVDVQIPEKTFIREATQALAGARNLDELKNLVRDRTIEVNVVESEDGWFKPVPGDRKSELFMQTLEQARQQLEQRGAVEKARDATSRAFETGREAKQAWSERREHDKVLKEAHAENDARDQAERVKVDAKETVQKEALAEQGRQRAEQRAQDEAFEADLARRRTDADAKEAVGRKSLAEETAERQKVATRPLMRQILEMDRKRNELRSRSERRGVGDDHLRQIDADFSHALAEMRTQLDELNEYIANQVRIERGYGDSTNAEQVRALMAFEAADNPPPYVFKPTEALRPDIAAEIAASNAEELDRITPPHEVNEYMIGNTVMQRLVYRTSNRNVVIVEDWDKTSGKLKRQAALKGDRLLIPDYENDGLGRLATRRRKKSGESRLVLSNDIYASLGKPVMSADVSRDSGTSYAVGHANYSKNLVRAGGVGFTDSRKMAGHEFKPKQSKKFKGFIATLQEKWAGAAR